jgi:hypothetical protein
MTGDGSREASRVDEDPFEKQMRPTNESIAEQLAGRLSGHDHVLSRKYYGQDPGNHIEGINQYDVADL